MLNAQDVVKDRYRVVRSIGGGAFGTVYLVEDMSCAMMLRALKEMVEGDIPPDERDDSRDLFSREAQMLKSLSHDGLPEVVDFFSMGDRHYLVTEYIEGQTLEEIQKQRGRPFPPEELLHSVKQLSAILSYLHERSPDPDRYTMYCRGNYHTTVITLEHLLCEDCCRG